MERIVDTMIPIELDYDSPASPSRHRLQRIEIATSDDDDTPLEPSSPSQDYRRPYGSIVDGSARPAMTVRSVGRHGHGEWWLVSFGVVVGAAGRRAGRCSGLRNDVMY